ncbi:hypothetical protein CA267_006080 [Alteromonas pelagimontana]|uniref:Uncharacterized protein n=1 Tax=Alteromonas pelagimontana TaxID=1858656 RepID=A0A6M4MB23_9ALTE|nr:hypothetical protein [Alteromonas pelagimontana]QJR80372.1 hypothetical protein CA267_006080 [Alteromonas pelagimontana]
MTLLRGFLAFIAVLLIVLAGLVLLMIDTEPQVRSNASEQMNEADTVKKLLTQIEESIRDRHDEHTITVSETQFDSLVGFVQRASASFRGKVNVSASNTLFEASVAVPIFGRDWYLNVESVVLPGNKLDIDYVSIGSLKIPGSMAVGLVELGVNWWTKSDIASLARKQINSVTMSEQVLAVQLKPMDGLLKQLNEVKNGLSVDQDDELRDLTAYYLRYISWQQMALSEDRQRLLDYLRVLMTRVQQRSTPETAVLHNKAAIFGLAIFVGHHRLANIVGDVQPNADKALKPAAPALLKDREDLAKHFIISAALQLHSEQALTFAIGEFKELMDRSMDGSGYSFVDLTADMAGVELARAASNPEFARELQQQLINAEDESLIMPDIDGLVEGLSKAQFELRFDKVDSEAYLQEVAKIRSRLQEMPLYQH